MIKSDYKPRITFEISIEQQRELSRLVPHGVQGKMYRALTNDLIVILKSEHRERFIGAILSGKMHAYDFMKAGMDKEE